MSFVQPFLEKRLSRLVRTVHRACELSGLRQPPARTVFMHIPKCGGTSINWAVKSYLGSSRTNRVVLIDDTASPAVRREQIARARDATFVGGHFGFETLEQIREGAFVFTVLRDPVSRLKSVHGFLSTLAKRNPVPEHFRNLDPREFFASRDESVLQWTDNVMARSLALSWDRARAEVLSPGELAERAIRNLGQFDFIADTRSLTADMSRVSAVTNIPTLAKLGWHNATKADGRHLRSHRDDFHRDTEIRNAIQTLIHADLSVYDHAELRHQSATLHAAKQHQFAG